MRRARALRASARMPENATECGDAHYLNANSLAREIENFLASVTVCWWECYSSCNYIFYKHIIFVCICTDDFGHSFAQSFCPTYTWSWNIHGYLDKAEMYDSCIVISSSSSLALCRRIFEICCLLFTSGLLFRIIHCWQWCWCVNTWSSFSLFSNFTSNLWRKFRGVEITSTPHCCFHSHLLSKQKLEKSEIRVNLEWIFVLFTHFGVTSGITRNPWVIPVVTPKWVNNTNIHSKFTLISLFSKIHSLKSEHIHSFLFRE